MPASLQCTGPANFFVGLGNNSSPVYLGTMAQKPQISRRPRYQGVPNDLAGTQLPLDQQYQGTDAIASGLLTRFDPVVYSLMAAAAIPTLTSPGLESFGNMGAFMQLEGCGFPLWVTFPYVTKAAMSAIGLPPGYRFPIAYLLDPITEGIGTEYRSVGVAFYCQRQFSVTNGGQFLLFDYNMTGLPAIS